jgi:CubicO group peptidase (beta-lactamase class C family)
MVTRGEAPSAALAVAKDGRVIWEEGFGWADLERKVKASPTTVYPVASLSKSMTATGVMVLAERGSSIWKTRSRSI